MPLLCAHQSLISLGKSQVLMTNTNKVPQGLSYMPTPIVVNLCPHLLLLTSLCSSSTTGFLPQDLCMGCPLSLECSSPHTCLAHPPTSRSLLRYHLLNRPSLPAPLTVPPAPCPSLTVPNPPGSGFSLPVRFST